MAAGFSFMRFYVVLRGEWVSQCPNCWLVVAKSRNENELALAEAAHQCVAKKPSASAGAERRAEKALM